MKQLVLSGNRVLAHGEDCFFSSIGGVVFCMDSGRYFTNATVANVTGEIPADIDSVGYEYHAGKFVPCAPFGKGGGNVAVLCPEDCKSIKDSGKSAANLGNVAVVEYIGTGTDEVTITTDFEPLFAVVYLAESDFVSGSNYLKTIGVITPNGGFISYILDPKSGTSAGTAELHYVFSSVDGNSLTWNCPYSHSSKSTLTLNKSGTEYRAFVVGRA